MPLDPGKFNKKDLASGLFFLALGLFLILWCRGFSIWSSNGPEEGFFPFFTGIIIMASSLLILAKSFVLSRAPEKEGKLVDPENGVNVFKVSSYAILMLLLYGFLMESLGFLIASVLFLTLTIKVIEKQSWKITLLVASVSIVVSYILFVYFMGVPLPKGVSKWW
jgi:putative tricarboxylic transport membrane protein